MKVMQLLEKCRKGQVSVRKALAKYGLIELEDGNVPLKEKSEQEVFAYLINWTVNEMNHTERMFIRYRVKKEIYQMEFHYTGRHLRMNKPVMLSTDESFVLYEWEDTDTFNGLTAQRVQDSIRRANSRNYQLGDDEVESRKFWESWATTNLKPLTTEDYELVEDFLDV